MERSKPTVGIVGGGITGLAVAYVLSEHFNVKVIARDLPGDLGTAWASPWAGAVFHPDATEDVEDQYLQATSLLYWKKLADKPTNGVQTLRMVEYFDAAPPAAALWQRQFPGFAEIAADQLPPSVGYGVAYESMTMNTQLVLPWLFHLLQHARGVRFTRATVPSLAAAAAQLGHPAVLINASGVGARALARDASVTAVRGQTLFVPAPHVDFTLMRTGSEYTYVIPRAGSGGVILGGVKMEGRDDARPDDDVRADIVRRVQRLTGDTFAHLDVSKGVRAVAGAQDIVGFRPGRKGGLRVEREGNIVHAYGAGGAGYIYSFGVADKVLALTKEILTGEKRRPVTGEDVKQRLDEIRRVDLRAKL